jgi:hypothetical protein
MITFPTFGGSGRAKPRKRALRRPTDTIGCEKRNETLDKRHEPM